MFLIRYGEPRDTRMVGFHWAVVSINSTAAGGRSMFPSPETGRTAVMKMVIGALRITALAES